MEYEIDYDLLGRLVSVGISGGLGELADKAEAIGEAFGRGFRRANPPLGLVGRRCGWQYAEGEMHTGTILTEPDSDGYALVNRHGELIWACVNDLTLLPWMAEVHNG